MKDRYKPITSLRNLFKNIFISNNDKELQRNLNPGKIKEYEELFLNSGTFENDKEYKLVYNEKNELVDIQFCYDKIIFISIDLLTELSRIRVFIKLFEQLAYVSYSAQRLIEKEYTEYKMHNTTNTTSTMNVWKLGNDRGKETTIHFKSSEKIRILKETLFEKIIGSNSESEQILISAKSIYDFIDNDYADKYEFQNKLLK